MEYFEIKSDKQENGLWGTPMNLVYLYCNNFIGTDDEIKFSAILISLCEKFSNAFISIKSDIGNDNKFWVTVENRRYDLQDTSYIINMSDYGLIGNKLFYIKNEEDKKQFNRIRKLNKLKQNNKICI
jgi:hypothetical protein